MRRSRDEGDSDMFRIFNLIPSTEDSLEKGNKRFWSDMRKWGARRRRRGQVGLMRWAVGRGYVEISLSAPWPLYCFSVIIRIGEMSPFI